MDDSQDLKLTRREFLITGDLPRRDGSGVIADESERCRRARHLRRRGRGRNAIYNATGVRVRDYPITLDKLLAGMPQAV